MTYPIEAQTLIDFETTPKNLKQDVTFWFDTTPKTYRGMTIWTKLTEAERNKIISCVENEHSIENKRKEILNSVGKSTTQRGRKST